MRTDIKRAAPIEIKPDLRLADAFQQIIGECVSHVSANVPLASSHPAALHQVRVGLRRARSALALFKVHLVSANRKPLNQQMRDLANHLGSSRDWDVFIDETLPKVQKQGALNEENAAILRDLAILHRRDGRVDDIEDIWQAVSANLGGLAMRGDDLGEAIEDMAPDLLAKEARRVRRCIKHIDTPEERHNLRKALKRMRYSAEFLESLYRHKAVKHYLDRCKDCQDVLGQMNDNATTIRLCCELANSELGNREITGSIIVWAERQETQASRQLAEPLGKFRSTKPFWH